MINNENYIQISGWMINKLNLKGNELFIYAIIYSFSQDGKSEFRGSLQYLADWTNSTPQGVLKAIKSLLQKGLIIKKEIKNGCVKLCSYVVDETKFNGTIKQSLMADETKFNGTIKQSLMNNTIYIQDDNTNLNNKQKPKKRNSKAALFDRVDEYTSNVELRDILKQYLKFKLSHSKNYDLTQWNIQLDMLKQYSNGNEEVAIKKVKLSFAANYQSLVFSNELNNNQQGKQTYQQPKQFKPVPPENRL